MRKISRSIALMLAFVMCLSLGVTPVLAADVLANKEIMAVETNTVLVNEAMLEINQADIVEYVAFSDSLADKLKVAESEDYDSVIQEYFASNANPVFESVLEVIDNNTSAESILYLNVPSEFIEKYEETYEIDDNTMLIVTPTYIVIDTLTTANTSDSLASTAAAAATSSTSGVSSKTYYGLLGNKLFSLAVECGFYYDGSSAWYKDGFDYYYSKGTLSFWKVTNWKGWKEKSGTSYKAYCAGNFSWGVKYQDNELIFQDIYCKNTVSCTKDGLVSRNATMD